MGQPTWVAVRAQVLLGPLVQVRKRGVNLPGRRVVSSLVIGRLLGRGRQPRIRLGCDELTGYCTIVGLGMMPGEHLLGAISCIDGGQPFSDPPGSTSRDMSVSAKLANLLPSAAVALARPSGGV